MWKWRFPASYFLFVILGFETPKYLGSLPLKLLKFQFSIEEVMSARPTMEPSTLSGFFSKASISATRPLKMDGPDQILGLHQMRSQKSLTFFRGL
jgi:hypothetical protein